MAFLLESSNPCQERNLKENKILVQHIKSRMLKMSVNFFVVTFINKA